RVAASVWGVVSRHGPAALRRRIDASAAQPSGSTNESTIAGAELRNSAPNATPGTIAVTTSHVIWARMSALSFHSPPVASVATAAINAESTSTITPRARPAATLA